MDIQGVCIKTTKTSRMKGYDTWAQNWIQFHGRTLIIQPNYKLYIFQIVLKKSYRIKTNPQIKLLTKINLPKIFAKENLVQKFGLSEVPGWEIREYGFLDEGNLF